MRNIEIKITQCQVGRYNLLSDDETLSFGMALYEDGKVLEKDGVKAVLRYSGDSDEYEDFRYYSEEDLGWIFDKCYSYAKRTWGTTDYEAQALLFLTEYCNSFEDIAQTTALKQKERLEKQIEDLRRKLDGNLEPYDYRYAIDKLFEKEVARYQKWLDDEKDKRTQYVVGSDLYDESQKRIEGYEKKIDVLKSYLPSNEKEESEGK